jgi:hypothetical protein
MLNEVYSGEWRENMKNGTGKYTFENNDVYHVRVFFVFILFFIWVGTVDGRGQAWERGVLVGEWGEL